MAERQALAAAWTPERRAEASERARAKYESWAAEHPDRAAFVVETRKAIEEGGLVRPTCSLHARAGKPRYDWTSMAVVGWTCPSGHYL